MQYQQIRDIFTQYFKAKAHTHVPSASLIPAGDKSIMFTNAGMNQFKDVFCGLEHRDYNKAVSVQRCLRAGGKHNDLENVGYTTRHHTFFEMLGNFSFGDYFKEEAIDYALEFILKEIQLPFDKLLVSVHQSDDEAFNLWKKKGFSESRIIRLGDKDNFWSMGDVGPCGPCSEIFYDMGDHIAGGPPGSAEQDGDRFKEIWNLVFMQYQTDQKGQRTPLPKPSVDTGMGLERLASVIEGVDSNFDTSFFRNLKQHLRDSLALKTNDINTIDVPLNVISDHLRASIFMINDGILPQNEGRGYVLRRIIRRALRYGYKLGVTKSFMHESVAFVIDSMGLSDVSGSQVVELAKKTLEREQDQFFDTLDSGMKYLEQQIDKSSNELDGRTLFKLYDTYGFPLDIATDIAKEKSLKIDVDGYNQCMSEQKERSRSQSSSKFKVQFDPQELPSTPSVFERGLSSITNATIQAVIPCQEHCYLVFNKTPFYAESGGQVGDTGYYQTSTARYEVLDTIKSHQHHLHLIKGTFEDFKVGDEGTLSIDVERRNDICRHHTATHLLHAALREVLGKHVAQKGSLVNEHRLRFDFSHHEPITQQQIDAIEKSVNEQLLKNPTVTTEELSYQGAIDKGALAFFDDKYGEKVRMLSMGCDQYSIELCGGTHVKSLGEIGSVEIVEQESVASGVRRIQAVAGRNAFQSRIKSRTQRIELSQKLSCSDKDLLESVDKMLVSHEELKLEHKALLWELCQHKVRSAPSKNINNIAVFLCEMDSTFTAFMKKSADINKNFKRSITIVTIYDKDKTSLLLSASKDLKGEVSLKGAIKHLQKSFPLKGGGRDDMVQAGGVLSLDEYKAMLIEIDNFISQTEK